MYPDPNSRSQKMYDRALASLPGGNTRTTVFMKPYPIYAARGEGCRVGCRTIGVRLVWLMPGASSPAASAAAPVRA